MDTSTSPVPTSTTGPDSRTCTCCRKAILCCCWVLALVITLALAGSLCGTVWRHVFHTQVSDDINVYNNKSAVIVTELNQYYDGQLQLFPNVTNSSIIEIYRFNTSCDRLIHSVPDDPQYKYITIYGTPVIVTSNQQICNISDIDEERNCTVDLEFKIGKVCIVAYTEYEDGNLRFKVTKNVLKVLLTSALPTALFLLALFTGLVVYIIYTAIKFCCRKRNNQYALVNVQT